MRILSVLAVVAAGLLAYSNTANVPFLFDDSVRIVYNAKIRSLAPSVAMFETNRPIVNYTFAINYALHADDVRGYHLLNLVIHLAAGLCLFGIARRSLLRFGGWPAESSEYLALAIAVLWVVHPLQTQAVTYINQRYESLMGLAYLATLYCFIRSLASRHTTAWQVASVTCCGMGMGCKEAMVSAPLVVLWYDRALVAASWRELISKRQTYYFFLGSTWAILAWAMLHYTDEYTAGGMVRVTNVTPWTYLLSQSEVIVEYLRLSIWPVGQCFFGKWPIAHSIVDVLPQALCVLGLGVGTLWCIFRQPWLGFLGGWFFLILAPTSSFVPIRDFIFEHRMYLPLAAVVALLVLGTYGLLLRGGLTSATAGKLHRCLCLAAAVGLAIATYRRNADYRSEIALWQDTVEQAPHHAEAWHNLGLAYVNAGRSSEAIQYLSEAAKLAPDDAKTNSSYGGALVECGQYELATKYLATALRKDPDDHVALRNMGNLLLDTGNGIEAIPFCERAVQLAPPDAELRMSLVSALIVGKRFEDALEQCRIALQEQPNFAKAHLNMVSIYTQLGQAAKAIEHGQAAVQADPDNPLTQGTLGMLLEKSDPDRAIAHLTIACQLDSQIAEFNRSLGNLLAKEQPHKAIPYFQALLAIDQDNVEVRYKLASLYVLCGQLDKAIQEIERVAQLRPESSAAQNYLQKLRNAAQPPAR